MHEQWSQYLSNSLLLLGFFSSLREHTQRCSIWACDLHVHDRNTVEACKCSCDDRVTRVAHAQGTVFYFLFLCASSVLSAKIGSKAFALATQPLMDV
jgi:hypothetical protein